MDRLDRFRTYFERLDPTATPRATSKDLYVAPPGRAMGDQIASKLQLAPSSTQLLAGGVGAGKSTQLYRAGVALGATADTQAVYVDVSRRHDLDKNLAGVLIVLAGLELARLVAKHGDAEVKATCQRFRDWAHGHAEFIPYDPHDDWDDGNDYPDDDEEPGRWVPRPGVINAPLPPLPKSIKERVEALKTLKAALPDGTRHFVILFDSLDLIDDVEAFRKAAVEDVRALKQAGIGVALVGPMRLLYGPDRHLVDIFDRLHILPAFDVANDSEARDFFRRVLAKRTDESFLDVEIAEKLVTASGGLLRDLLHLTRSAVEAAFDAEADALTTEHVDAAIDELGRTMMFGLRKGEIGTLQHLRLTGAFVPTNENDVGLIVSRRVIEYRRATADRFTIHPVILPLLGTLESKK